MTILILGIMLSSGISAIVSIMQYFSNETMLKAYVIWTMGSLGNLTSSQMNVMLISVSAGVILCLISVKMLNALLLGENYAGSIGLECKVARFVIITCTSILAGSVTAFCGPIGFIGIAVPHIARNIFRTSDHKILIPGTILTGGIINACKRYNFPDAGIGKCSSGKFSNIPDRNSRCNLGHSQKPKIFRIFSDGKITSRKYYLLNP